MLAPTAIIGTVRKHAPGETIACCDAIEPRRLSERLMGDVTCSGC
jgi:hypothetical protein